MSTIPGYTRHYRAQPGQCDCGRPGVFRDGSGTWCQSCLEKQKLVEEMHREVEFEQRAAKIPYDPEREEYWETYRRLWRWRKRWGKSAHPI